MCGDARPVTHLKHVDSHETAEQRPTDAQHQQEDQVTPEDIMQTLGDITKEVLWEGVVIAGAEDVVGEEVEAADGELGVRRTRIPDWLAYASICRIAAWTYSPRHRLNQPAISQERQ